MCRAAVSQWRIAIAGHSMSSFIASMPASWQIETISAPEQPSAWVSVCATYELCDLVEVDVGRECHGACAQLEDAAARADVRRPDVHEAVEAPRAQQRRVDAVGAVCRGDHHDVARGVDAVHLGEQARDDAVV